MYCLLRYSRKNSGSWDEEVKDGECMPDEGDVDTIIAAPEALTVCKHIYDRLSDLPDATRSPEERLNELYEWITEEFRPMLESVLK